MQQAYSSLISEVKTSPVASGFSVSEPCFTMAVGRAEDEAQDITIVGLNVSLLFSRTSKEILKRDPII